MKAQLSLVKQGKLLTAYTNFKYIGAIVLSLGDIGGGLICCYRTIN